MISPDPATVWATQERICRVPWPCPVLLQRDLYVSVALVQDLDTELQAATGCLAHPAQFGYPFGGHNPSSTPYASASASTVSQGSSPISSMSQSRPPQVPQW